MPNISEMANPVALTGLELVPGLQGDDDVGVPLLALGDALPRGAVLLLRKPFLADTASTTAGDPGAGNVRWNHATQASATEIYIDDADAAAGDVSGVWATLQVGGFLYLQGVVGAARAKYQKWGVSAKVDEAGYGKLTVTLVSSAGSFADDEAVEMTLQQPTPSAGVDRDVVTALTSSAGLVTVDCSLGDYFTLTPTEVVTGWAFTNVPVGCTISIVLTQGATPYAAAMPSAKWVGGIAGAFSTAASAVDELSLSTTNSGTPWRAALGKAFT